MRCIAILTLAAIAQASSLTEHGAANPIRKVVNMLTRMQDKVQAEAKAGQALHDKYVCYCKNGANDLQSSISAAATKIPAVTTDIQEGEAEKKQLDIDLRNHKADREGANTAMATASALREKENSAFTAMKTEADSNIAAIANAVSALEKGMTGFLQTSTASVLRKLYQSQIDVSDVDRQDMLAFLAGGAQQGASYVPQSGQITGLLKQLGDSMAKDLADATAGENDSKSNFDGLMSAKSKEVRALTAAIEEKTVRSGEVAVHIVQMKEDLSDTQAAQLEDQSFLADMDKNCAKQEAEWEQISKTRSEELVALAETIALLNSDDALELFKSTLPSAAASLVQVKVSAASVRNRAAVVLRTAQSKVAKSDRHQLDFVLLALRGKGGFAHVLTLIDELVAQLHTEQTDDDTKKTYCEKELDAKDDSKKQIDLAISDAEKAIATAEEAIATLTSESKALHDGVEKLDKSVAAATAQRKDEHNDFTELMASNTAAVQLIGLAKNRMNQFYNPSLHTEAAKRELSEEDRIAVNNGGTAPPTPAPGGISGTGITALVDVSAHMSFEDKPPPAPDAPQYAAKTEESTGVIAMMDMLIQDLDKEMQEAETAEKDAQADYEQMSSDAAAKRIADTKAIAEKKSATANTEAELQHQTEEKASSTKELMATLELIASLHSECDWLVSNFEVRKEARTNEVDSLNKAKAVLSGADFSLLQTKSRSLRGKA